jgi:AAA family ATP:ADP antiporter
MLFFVWVSVFNLFVVSVFWSFMSDIWSSEQARRLFPIIAVAGTVGAVTGPALTRSLVGVIGVAPLLVVSAGLLCIALGCVVALGHWAPAWRASARTGARSRRGWRHVRRFEADFRRPVHPQHVAAAVAGRRHRHGQLRIGDGLFQPQLRRRCHRAHAFAANVDLAANVLTVIAQLTLTRWLLPKKGPAPVILIWALVSIAVLLVVVFSPDPHAPLLLGMPAVAVALIVSRGLAYGMAEPARHSLYTRVPRNVRYKGQNAVDTAVWRFGDLSIALSMNGLKLLGMATGGFAGISAVAAMVAAGIGWRLSRRTDALGSLPSAERSL